MRLWNSPQGYGAVAKLWHWLTVGLVAAGWLLGTFGDDWILRDRTLKRMLPGTPP
jgi:cytochrome b561